MFLNTIQQHNSKLLASITSTVQPNLLRNNCFPDFNPCSVLVLPAGENTAPYFAKVRANVTEADVEGSSALPHLSTGLDRHAEDEFVERFMELSCQLVPLRRSVLKIMQQSCTATTAAAATLGLEHIGHCSSTDMSLEPGMMGLECFFLKDSSNGIGAADMPINRHVVGSGDSSSSSGGVVVRGPVVVAASVGLDTQLGWILLAILQMPVGLLQKGVKDGMVSCVHKCISSAAAGCHPSAE
jgi:hypothetical protein